MNATTTPVHADVTFDRLENAMRDGDAGFCIACGAETDGVEPDASEYRCDECGEPKVYGAEELLLRNLLHDEPATAGWTPRPAAGRSAAGAVRFPPATDTYHAGQADELLQDIAQTWTIERVDGRSVWRTWTSAAQAAEEIRIALRGHEGWYVHVPLDSNGMPYDVVASLRQSEAEPDTESNV